MPALSDRTFNPQAWAKLGLVAVGLAAIAGLVRLSMWAHERYVEVPRLLSQRFDDPPGHVGDMTTRISHLGTLAVPTLLADLDGKDAVHRSKALELLSTLTDPRVVPALGKSLQDKDTGVQLAAIAALARTGLPAAAEQLWPVLDRTDDLTRLRATIALGLCGTHADAQRLLTELGKAEGIDRAAQAWAAGRIERRIAHGDVHGYLRAAPVPSDNVDARRIQDEVDAARVALDAGRDIAAQAAHLSELTDLDYATWDYGHQLGAQLLALGGPLALHAAGGADALAPPKPTERHLDFGAH